jgi:hypothetical protein
MPTIYTRTIKIDDQTQANLARFRIKLGAELGYLLTNAQVIQSLITFGEDDKNLPKIARISQDLFRNEE